LNAIKSHKAKNLSIDFSEMEWTYWMTHLKINRKKHISLSIEITTFHKDQTFLYGSQSKGACGLPCCYKVCYD